MIKLRKYGLVKPTFIYVKPESISSMEQNEGEPTELNISGRVVFVQESVEEILQIIKQWSGT